MSILARSYHPTWTDPGDLPAIPGFYYFSDPNDWRFDAHGERTDTFVVRAGGALHEVGDVVTWSDLEEITGTAMVIGRRPGYAQSWLVDVRIIEWNIAGP